MKPPISSEDPSFSPALFAFLNDLANNNERPWFEANKERYEADVREPALAFIEDVGMRLPAEVSEHLRAEAKPNGGSLFRIHRDIRFSKDKTPYKTHVGIQFRHARAKDAHAPMLYLHLEPGRVFMGAGMWRPDREALQAIRTAIAARPKRWEAATTFAEEALALSHGDPLKRPPQGFDPEHPLIEELKRRSFVASAELSQQAATAPDFLDRYVALAAAADPFMRLLCEATRVEY